MTRPSPPPRRLVWATLLGAGTLYELHQLRSDRQDTLSAFARWAFFVDTPLGRTVFLVGWRAFSRWFEGHILSQPLPPQPASSARGGTGSVRNQP